MGKARRPARVKLLAGILYNDSEVYFRARLSLERFLGRIDYESPEREFNHTNYYGPEMGAHLKRKFLSFEKLRKPDGMHKVKAKTNAVEKRLSVNGKRRVNIDPGYLDLAKFVLFSTKDYSHRVYIGNGIYAENTLRYRDKAFRPWPWTYPDYRTDEYIGILNSIRKIYKSNIEDLC